MKNYKLLLITMSFILVNCKDAGDPCESYASVDLEMLNTVEAIKEQHRGDQEFLVRFRDAQIYWVQYKDRHMRALYPKDWDRYYRETYGTEVFNPCKCKELLRLTELRVADLKRWLEKTPLSGQEECPSEWKK